MSGHPLMPYQAHQLGPSSVNRASGESAKRRTIHWRRPRLERVTCLSYGGGLLAAAGGLVCCVWDTRTHRLLNRLVAADPITAVWMAHDGKALAVGAGTGVTVCDPATGLPRFSYAHGAQVASIHIDAMAHVMASADIAGRIEVRDLASGKAMQHVQASPGRPIVFAYRRRYVLIGSETHSSIVDAATGELLRRFPYEPDESPAPGGLLLSSTLVAHSGTFIRWFDCAVHEPAHCIRNLGSPISSIDIWEPDGLVLAATQAGTLHLFGLTSGARRASYQSFTTPVLFARFGADASLYVAGGEALVMRLMQGRHVQSYADETVPLVAMAAQPGHKGLLVSNRNGGLTRVDLADGRTRTSSVGHTGSVSVVACAGEHIASGAYDGTVRLLDAQLRSLATIDLDQGPVQSIALDPSSRRAWAGTWSGKVNCMSLDTGEVELKADAFGSSVRTLAHDASGRRLCAGGDDGEVCIFDLRWGMARLHEHQQPGTVYRALFDDTADHLWTTAGDGVRRYEGSDLRRHVTFAGNAIRWFELADGRLYSLSLSGTLAAFDIESGKELHRTVIESPVNHRSVVVLSSNRIATASADGLVRVFDSQLRQVGSLEVLRNGYLWMTSPVDAHPGWLHTDRPKLVEVGERSDTGLQHFAETDHRRARHLAVFHSATHVMRIVRGEAGESDSIGPRPGRLAGLVNFANLLQWAPSGADANETTNNGRCGS